MLTYDLSKRGKTPLYDYLYQCIRQDIITGRLTAGTRLPPKRPLASHLKVGIITVMNAYAQLVTEGYAISHERKGYFVADVRTYQVRSLPAPVVQAPEAQPDCFADFKANRISLQNFPAATWTHLMRQTLASASSDLWQTVPWNGLLVLRQAIADYLQQNRAMEVCPGQIIIGAGTEYLYSRLLQLFGRQAALAMEDPGYKKFAAIAQSFGNPWCYIPIDNNGLMTGPLETSGASIVHLSPANHFPTGIIMPVPRRLELFHWVNRAPGRYIIEDDYDSEFRYTGKFILPLYAQDTRQRVIYLNTFSKTLVPSLRISYMVLPPRLLTRYEAAQSFYSCTVSSFEQLTLARFLNEGCFERHINRMKKYYRGQRALILRAFADSPLHAIARITERNAGTHFLLTIDTPLTRPEISRRATTQGLRLSFLDDYRSAPAASPNITLVINYAGIAREKIDEAVQRLAAIFL